MIRLRPKLPAGVDVRKIRPDINDLKTQVFEMGKTVYGRGDRPSRGFDANAMHPFRVYQRPHIYRRSAFDTFWQENFPGFFGYQDKQPTIGPADWRKFLVRSGRIGRTTVGGTDGIADPWTGQFGSINEFEVPDQKAAWYVWIEYSLPEDEDVEAPEATIRQSGSPATTIAGDADSGRWPGFSASPNPGGTCTSELRVCILIAVIDTNTQRARYRASVRQLVISDLPDCRKVCVLVQGEEKAMDVFCTGRPVDIV